MCKLKLLAAEYAILITYFHSTVKQHLGNVDWSESHMQTFQTLQNTSPVLLRTYRYFQAPIELCIGLSDAARAFSHAPERTCGYEGTLPMVPDVTIMIVPL
jgi:hypothetical protein